VRSAQLNPDPGGNSAESRSGPFRPSRHERRGEQAGDAGPAESRRILGVRVDATSYEETSRAVIEMAFTGSGGMVCVATTHSLLEARDDPDFRRLLNSAERVTPDGMPLVWGLRALGVRHASRVYGPSLMPAICRIAQQRGLKVGLYGGTPEVLDALRAHLHERFPRLAIPFAFSPPFRELGEEEERDVSDAIVESGVQVLFVGLGCPKQERWMAAHRAAFSCAMVGVGAAFDFVCGAKSQAPGWMQSAGLEWLFRLIHEPRRLWRRYLIGNARFLYHFVVRGNRD
jgi:N-acetylglucosaminyldiphosphoundecaprenol N-acetyl-beta-D-mannosaminyltransferase